MVSGVSQRRDGQILIISLRVFTILFREAGSPLMSVVETGVTRPNFAADALGVLFKELRLHCQEAGAPGGDPEACKVALVVDGMSRYGHQWNLLLLEVNGFLSG